MERSMKNPKTIFPTLKRNWKVLSTMDLLCCIDTPWIVLMNVWLFLLTLVNKHCFQQYEVWSIRMTWLAKRCIGFDCMEALQMQLEINCAIAFWTDNGFIGWIKDSYGDIVTWVNWKNWYANNGVLLYKPDITAETKFKICGSFIDKD